MHREYQFIIRDRLSNHSSLDGSCYDIGNKISLKYYATCLESDTKLIVSICQLQPVISDGCSTYGLIPSKDKEFKLEVTNDLVPGNIYCVALEAKDKNVTVNGGLFLVTKKGCDYGKCVPLIFINR